MLKVCNVKSDPVFEFDGVRQLGGAPTCKTTRLNRVERVEKAVILRCFCRLNARRTVVRLRLSLGRASAASTARWSVILAYRCASTRGHCELRKVNAYAAHHPRTATSSREPVQ